MKPAQGRFSRRRDASSEAVQTTAADWLARRDEGLTADEQAQFSEWLLADARHVAAVREIEAAWRFMQKPRFTGQADLVVQAVEQRTRSRSKLKRWPLFAGSLAAAAALAFAVVALRHRSAPAPIEWAGQVEVKPERRSLPDGSVVELKAGTDVSFNFSTRERNVHLLRGEAHFAVAKDAARPFVVTAGSVAVHAVGTEFSVRMDSAAIDVLVTEGRVAVERRIANPSPATVAPAPTYLDAGTRTVVPVATAEFTLLKIEAVAAPQIASALAWRTMRVEFTATPLGEIVLRLNQQNRTQLALADPTLADLRISGIFWLDDPDGFARLIEASAGLRTTTDRGGQIVLSRR